jgi:hypothetical protein
MEYKNKQYYNKRNKTHIMKTRQKRKNEQTRLFKLKYELIKISTNLQTEFAVETIWL